MFNTTFECNSRIMLNAYNSVIQLSLYDLKNICIIIGNMVIGLQCQNICYLKCKCNKCLTLIQVDLQLVTGFAIELLIEAFSEFHVDGIAGRSASCM